MAHHPGNQVAERYAQSILDYLLLGYSNGLTETKRDPVTPEIRSTNKTAPTLAIRSIDHPALGVAGSRTRVVEDAYSIFLGTCKFLREGYLPQTQLEFHVIDQTSGQPLTNAEIALDGTLQLATDSSGTVVFQGFSPRIYRLVARAGGYTEQETIVDAAHQKGVVIELRPVGAHEPQEISRREDFTVDG